MLRRLPPPTTLMAAGLIACAGCAGDSEDRSTLPISPAVDIVLAPDSEVQRALVPARATLASLLAAHDLVAGEVDALMQTLVTTFDLRRLRAGQSYRVDRFFDGRLREFEYEIDADRRLLVRRRDVSGSEYERVPGEPSLGRGQQAHAADPTLFDAQITVIPKNTHQVLVEGRIDRDHPTLVHALQAAGERIELSLALADVFSGELDFSNDLQPGDSFRLLVERSTRDDGAFGGYGPVLAAEYVNAGRALQAVRFEGANGRPAYYDAHGRSLQRFFLKSPLTFDPRITSRFSRARRHPVLHTTRAHNGVDYAAPVGARVGAVAGGVVTFAGWTRGGGRTVKLRHADGFESEYLHLSSVSVQRGARIAQGATVGRVGATGLVTGPHLHYGLRRNGSYVNPVRAHEQMPPGEPIATVRQAAFAAERDRLFMVLAIAPATRRVN